MRAIEELKQIIQPINERSLRSRASRDGTSLNEKIALDGNLINALSKAIRPAADDIHDAIKGKVDLSPKAKSSFAKMLSRFTDQFIQDIANALAALREDEELSEEDLQKLVEATALVGRNARHFAKVGIGWDRPTGVDDYSAFELSAVKKGSLPPYLSLEDDGTWVVYPKGKEPGVKLFKDPQGNKWLDAMEAASANVIEMFFQGKL
jgi:hypothetical protein